MELDWDAYIAAVGNASAAAALNKLKSISSDALKNGSDYVVQQCQLVQKYTEQKGKGEITVDQYNSLMTDLSDVTKLESMKLNLEGRKLAISLAETCAQIVVDCLGALIVF